MLQKSSVVTLKSGDYDTKSGSSIGGSANDPYWTVLPTNFPLYERSRTKDFAESAFDGITRAQPLLTNITGCPMGSRQRPASFCLGMFPTIGFDIECNTPYEIIADPSNDASMSFLNVSFDHNDTFWELQLNMHWKNNGSCESLQRLQRNCTLKPAIVMQPVEFEMADPTNRQWAVSASMHISEGLFDSFSHLNTEEWWEVFPLAKASLLTPEDASMKYSEIWVENNAFQFSRPGIDDWYKVLDKHVIPVMGEFENNETYHSDTVVRTIPRPKDAKERVGNLYDAFKTIFSASFNIELPPDDIQYVSWENVTSRETGSYIIPSLRTHYADYLNDAPIVPRPCGFTMYDLTKEILDGIRLLTFQYAVGASQTLDPSPEISWVSSQGVGKVAFPDKYRYDRNVYQSNPYTLAGAAVIMFLAVICTASLFYGYDKLGRQVSLSPLETSLALSVFKDREGKASNATMNELVRIYGDVKVKYGEVKPNVLGMAPVDNVHNPKGGMYYK